MTTLLEALARNIDAHTSDVLAQNKWCDTLNFIGCAALIALVTLLFAFSYAVVRSAE